MSRSSSPEQGNRIYVSGYSLKETQEDIKAHFQKIGEIQEFSWKGRFCFIAFEKPEDAASAIKTNSQEFNGRSLVIEAARARKKDGACYQCGKEGHFARSCRYSRRSYSDERRHKKKKKHRKHSTSSSSSSSSSSRKKKKSKKHKKKNSTSSSRSRSSD